MFQGWGGAAALSIAVTSSGKTIPAASCGMRVLDVSLLCSDQQQISKGFSKMQLLVLLATTATFEGGCGGKKWGLSGVEVSKADVNLSFISKS